MADQPLYQFRLFFRDTPTMFSGWRAYDEERRWDRHYIIHDRLSLRIERGERVELTRWALEGHFAIEQTILSSTFPLDWMALSCIVRSLPGEYRLAEVDGRSAQAFVDSLALPGLLQASVLKNNRYLRDGAVMATASRVDIPDWSARAITVNLTCHHAKSLQLALEAVEMDRYAHLAFDDWMIGAHDAAFPQPVDEENEDEEQDPEPDVGTEVLEEADASTEPAEAPSIREREAA